MAKTNFDLPNKDEIKEYFSAIAPNYERLNHLLSFGLDFYWTHCLTKTLHDLPDGPICDIAAGTGVITRSIHKYFPTRRILSLDICSQMLKYGLDKSIPNTNLSCNISAITADVFALPIKDSSISAATIAFGLRNMPPYADALKEVFRILKPAGKLSILEFSSASKRKLLGLYNFYLSSVLPTIGATISGDKSAYLYLAESIKSFPHSDEIKKILLNVGFSSVKSYTKSFGIVDIYTAVKL